MKALWKAEGELDATFASLNRCLEDDWFLISHELKLQRAHAVALAEAGILTPEENGSIAAALDDIEQEFAAGPVPESDAEDLHTWLEAELVTRAGEAGKKIHTARSRNDQVATRLKMFAITSGESLRMQFVDIVRVCCVRAKDWAELVFPLQTHTQFAAPGSVGFWALSYATAFDRVKRRMGMLVTEWRRECPLGSGAVAGSSIPIDRRIQASELGFDSPSINALDATSRRDECLELLALCVQVGLHLQSLATDVIAFSQTPFGWTVYPQGFGTGSSMMPNKTNPDAMELLRGEANALIAAHSQAVSIIKGLPSGYSRDLQCLKPIVRDATHRLDSLLSMTVAFVGQLDFNAERLRESLRLGAIDATLRMERRVLSGMALRDAHHAVAGELGEADSGKPEEPIGAEAYQTIGCASPAETMRVADAILNEIGES